MSSSYIYIAGGTFVSSEELYHHGVKGQKWGIRNYQYSDGSLTPAGRNRYSSNSRNDKVDRMAKLAKTKVTGKQYVDGYIKSGTTLSRIQTSDKFEKYAFYATYKKSDINKYMGLYGKNLMANSYNEAKRAEKNANASGSEKDIDYAKQMRDKANNTKIYQVKLTTTKKLRVPSDENAGDITAKLLKEKKFKKDLTESIIDSKTKMKRPTQQVLFNQALKALKKDPDKMSSSEKVAVYKAFNLSLVHHNKTQIAAQNRFYKEMKKKGYNALLDYNDKEYSSYHAKRPMIVFDTDSVRLQSVAKANPKVIDRYYQRYNAERILKEVPANTVGLIQKAGSKTISECRSFVDSRLNDYLKR